MAIKPNSKASKALAKSGAARMTGRGYRPVQLMVEPDEYDTLRAAADLDERPLTKFVLRAALRAARAALAAGSAENGE